MATLLGVTWPASATPVKTQGTFYIYREDNGRRIDVNGGAGYGPNPTTPVPCSPEWEQKSAPKLSEPE